MPEHEGVIEQTSDQQSPVCTVDFKPPHGTSPTIVLHLVETATGGAPLVLTPNPLLRPLKVTLEDAVCS
jgi:hypothetical protein